MEARTVVQVEAGARGDPQDIAPVHGERIQVVLKGMAAAIEIYLGIEEKADGNNDSNEDESELLGSDFCEIPQVTKLSNLPSLDSLSLHPDR